MSKATHKRCKNRIQDDNGVVTNHPSINAAKRASRALGPQRVEVVSKLMNITREIDQYKAQTA